MVVRGQRRHLVAVALAPMFAYGFQLLGGRLLGPVGFAPISALWTVLFLATTALVVPVEQFVAREVDAGRRVLHLGRTAAGVVAVTVLVPVLLVAASLTRAFDARPIYLAVTAVMMLGMTSTLVTRGIHTGNRRFDLYARSILLEGSGRLALGLAGYLVTRDAVGVAWGLALGAFVALATPARRLDGTATPGRTDRAAAFLGPYVAAAVASQTLLAAAPLVVAALGAGAVAVSVTFVTFTTLRTPVTLLIALQARVLSAFLRRRASGDEAAVDRIVRRAVLAGLVAAVPGGLLGAVAAPTVIALLFGTEFRPGPRLAGLVTAGVVLALVNQFVGQASVARGRTRQLALAWGAGLAVAAAAALAPIVAGPIEERVALAFLIGEALTLTVLAAGTRRARGPAGRVP